jgi:hypothetical protein
MKNASGTKRNAMHLNGSNALAIGYGGYSASEGQSILYGNTVGLYHKSGININGTAMTDFVVAQGTSGDWTYRKWNSGYAECWGTKVVTPSWTKGGNFYYMNTSFVLPFTMTVQMTQVDAMSGGYLVLGSKGGTPGSRTYVEAVLWQYYNNAVENIRLAWYVKGTWK